MGISVDWASGDSFVIDVRAHFLTVDQPYADGGQDLGPTPTELFVASLAGCVGFYAERFLRRHGIAPDGLRVECDFEMASGPRGSSASSSGCACRPASPSRAGPP